MKCFQFKISVIIVFVIALLLSGSSCIGRKDYSENTIIHNYQIKDLCKEKVRIGIIDTGIDPDIIVLKGKILSGWNFVDNTNKTFNSPLDDYHGTYIATTIASIVPNLEILPIKCMRGSGGTKDNIIKGIQYAIAQGVKIINCSWNYEGYDNRIYELIKNNPDVLFIVSSSNYSVNVDEEEIGLCSYDCDNIIAVMACDKNGDKYGATGYGSQSIDVASPGVDIEVTISDQHTAIISGSSVATAFVTAEAGFLLSICPDLSVKDLKRCILSSVSVKDDLQGYCLTSGIINYDDCISYLIDNKL
ncbi:MAG: S8 family serine peptidase [Clostridia bacterium]|nr:S8 family serine peptidase [Clostridia bacterium]